MRKRYTHTLPTSAVLVQILSLNCRQLVNLASWLTHLAFTKSGKLTQLHSTCTCSIDHALLCVHINATSSSYTAEERCVHWVFSFLMLQIMDPPTVNEILAHCGVTDAQLENPCSNDDITAIARFLISWRTLAPHLGLDESEEEEIEEDGREEAEKKLKALRKWKSKFAHKATYKVLVEALVNINMAEHARHICQLVEAHCSK